MTVALVRGDALRELQPRVSHPAFDALVQADGAPQGPRVTSPRLGDARASTRRSSRARAPARVHAFRKGARHDEEPQAVAVHHLLHPPATRQARGGRRPGDDDDGGRGEGKARLLLVEPHRGMGPLNAVSLRRRPESMQGPPSSTAPVLRSSSWMPSGRDGAGRGLGGRRDEHPPWTAPGGPVLSRNRHTTSRCLPMTTSQGGETP